MRAINKSVFFNIKSGAQLEAKVTLNCVIENDGIGTHEFWGAKYNDKGQDYLEIESFSVEKVTYFYKGKDYKVRKITNEIKKAIDMAINQVELATN